MKVSRSLLTFAVVLWTNPTPLLDSVDLHQQFDRFLHLLLGGGDLVSPAAGGAASPHIAIEALRALVNEESVKATRHNMLRQRAFSERVNELMGSTPTSSSRPPR